MSFSTHVKAILRNESRQIKETGTEEFWNVNRANCRGES